MEKHNSAYLLFYDRITPLPDEDGETISDKAEKLEPSSAHSAFPSFSLAQPPLMRVEERRLVPVAMFDAIITDNREVTHERHIFSREYFTNLSSLIDLIGWSDDAKYEGILRMLPVSVNIVLKHALKIPAFNLLWSSPLRLFKTTLPGSQYDVVISSLSQKSMNEKSAVYLLVFRTWMCFLLDTYVHAENRNLFCFWMRNTHVCLFEFLFLFYSWLDYNITKSSFCYIPSRRMLISDYCLGIRSEE
jgi:hypothetical protein